MSDEASDRFSGDLRRQFGFWQATALNVTMIVGAGVFITIPYMLKDLPGPYAALAWVAGAILMLLDGLVWSELGAAMPGSGGSYVYLLECYGREKWGRPFAFLFIWQFLISGPLELGSGLIDDLHGVLEDVLMMELSLLLNVQCLHELRDDVGNQAEAHEGAQSLLGELLCGPPAGDAGAHDDRVVRLAHTAHVRPIAVRGTHPSKWPGTGA